MQTKKRRWVLFLCFVLLAHIDPGGAVGADRLTLTRTGAGNAQLAGRLGANLQLTAVGGRAEFELDGGVPVTAVTPGKGTVMLDVMIPARYAVLPDFFADDLIYDAVKVGRDTIAVPAENFLYVLVPGGDAMVMCVWQGAVRAATGEKSRMTGASSTGKEPKVELLYSGTGDTRHLSGVRIEFLGTPIHIALLEHKGLWRDEDLLAWPVGQAKETAWKRPFDARWRGDFVAVRGRESKNWMTGVQSFEFIGSKEYAERSGGYYPAESVWMDSLNRMNWPVWFNKDITYLCPYKDRAESTVKMPRDWTNAYERVLIYPFDRKAETPLAVFLPTDIMRATLGQGPCEYVLNLEGTKLLKDRIAGGGVCDAENRLKAYIGLLRNKGPDGRSKPVPKFFYHNPGISPGKGGKAADGQQEDFERAAIGEMEYIRHFLDEVNDRIEAYRAFGKGLDMFCAAEIRRNSMLKPLADRILQHAHIINTSELRTDYGAAMGERTIDSARKTFEQLITEVKEHKYDGLDAGTKFGHLSLGEAQDRLVGRLRRCTRAIQYEASGADVHDPDVRRFAAEIQRRCRDVLKARHPREGA